MAASRLLASIRSLRVSLRPGLAEPDADGPLLHRFVETGDEAAFAALVARHGPTVLSICRRVLDQTADAEDAFQATFLVLSRKARSLDGGRPLGGWLARVAQTTALKARQRAFRARRRDRAAARPETAPVETTVPDAWPVVLEEIERLPASFREVTAVCLLAGFTHEQAAARLGWPLGTVKTRLARARERLRTRLAQRGVAPAVAVAAGLAAAPCVAALSQSLAETVCRGGAERGLTPAARSLAEEVLKALASDRRSAVALFLGAALVVGAGLSFAPNPLGGPADVQGSSEAATPLEEKVAEAQEVEDPKLAQQIRELIPEASSSPVAEWRALGKPGAPTQLADFKNQSLSIVFFCLDPKADDPELDYGGTPNPHKLAEAVSRSQAKGYGTLLQPEFITGCTCRVRGDTATGVVTFKGYERKTVWVGWLPTFKDTPLYTGKVEYSAARQDGVWRVEEFRLPGRKLRIRRQADGVWKTSDLPEARERPAVADR